MWAKLYNGPGNNTDAAWWVRASPDGREVFEDILHGHAESADARLSAALVRLDGDDL